MCTVVPDKLSFMIVGFMLSLLKCIKESSQTGKKPIFLGLPNLFILHNLLCVGSVALLQFS